MINEFSVHRKPEVDEEDGGGVLDKVVGRVQLRNVGFIYPTRPEVRVLHDFSLDVAPGTSFALCGQSGSGKSTVVQASLLSAQCHSFLWQLSSCACSLHSTY